MIEKAEKSGAKIWEKSDKKRLYFNTKQVVADTFNYVLVDRIAGSVPAGFDGMLKKGNKTKSYIDLNTGEFFADSGDIANMARSLDFDTKRI